MPDNDLTPRILHEIQSTLADLRDDRTVLISILDRQDNSFEGLSAELRATRSLFDSLRNEISENFTALRNALFNMDERLSRLDKHFLKMDDRLSRIEDKLAIETDPA